MIKSGGEAMSFVGFSLVLKGIREAFIFERWVGLRREKLRVEQ